MLDNKKRVLLVNSSDIEGGAAKATLRIKRSIDSYSIQYKTRLLVDHTTSRLDGIDSRLNFSRLDGLMRLVQRKISSRISWYVQNLYGQQSTVAWPPSGLPSYLKRQYTKLDILHLHSLGNTLLSLSELPKLGKPIVWTLHDEWPTIGFQHYDINSLTACLPNILSCRSLTTRTSVPITQASFWLRLLTQFQRRRAERFLSTVDLFICPSNWLASKLAINIASFAPPTVVIPNPIDLDFWCPASKRKARAVLGLNQDTHLILYVGTHLSDPRKGYELLRQATYKLTSLLSASPCDQNVALMVAGPSYSLDQAQHGIKVVSLGSFSDDTRLRLAYSSCDVLCIPSVCDNLPNVALEAQACGVPIVCFNTGGLPEIVVNGETGLIVKDISPDLLAKSLYLVIRQPELLENMRIASRASALRSWDPSIIAKKYEDAYNFALSSWHRKTFLDYA